MRLVKFSKTISLKATTYKFMFLFLFFVRLKMDRTWPFETRFWYFIILQMGESLGNTIRKVDEHFTYHVDSLLRIFEMPYCLNEVEKGKKNFSIFLSPLK